MQIKLTVHIPEQQLQTALEKEKMTREEFKDFIREQSSTLFEADDLFPGSVAGVEITD
jgi:hypothetical protein